MSLALPRALGGRVWFRLSDVREDIRLRAAQKLAEAAVKEIVAGKIDLVEALDRGSVLRAIAEDPEHAREVFPGECQNAIRCVSRDEWERVMGCSP